MRALHALGLLSALATSQSDGGDKTELDPDMRSFSGRPVKQIRSGSDQFRDIWTTNQIVSTDSIKVGCGGYGQVAMMYLYYIKNNTLDDSVNKRKIVMQIFPSSGTAGEGYQGRVQKSSVHGSDVTFTITELTLDDAGYYYCEIHNHAAKPTITDLTEVVIWVQPTPPGLTVEDHYWSSETTKNDTGVDYSKEQLIATCRSEAGFPKPELKFLDIQTGEVLTEASDTQCLPNKVDKRKQDCHLQYRAIIHKSMNRRQLKCTLQHKSLRGIQQEATTTMNVWYPPFDMQMKGNLTEKTVTCSAIAHPKPVFYYRIGKSGTNIKMAELDDFHRDPTSERYTSKAFVSQLGDLAKNEVVYCVARNDAPPELLKLQQVEELFAPEPLLGKMHWIIIAAAGGAFVICLIIIICCCCRRKETDNEDSYAKGRSQSKPKNNHYGDHTLASNASYDYRQPSHSGPQSNVQEYLKRAASKEKLVDDYEVASAVQSNYSDYMSHVQRSRQLLARSQENLDHLGVEVNADDLQSGSGVQRADSFEPYDDHVDPRSKYQGQRNYHHDETDDHLYANDPQYDNQYRDNNYHDEASPPPPPRYESVNRHGDFSSPQLI